MNTFARARAGTVLVVAGGLALLALACGEDPAKPPRDLPASPDLLIRSYRDAYDARDSTGVIRLLLPQFEFHFAQGDIDSLPIDSSWGYALETSAVRRLFGEDTGLWPDGSEHAPMDPRFSFGLQMGPVDSAWTAVVEGPLAGTLTRRYIATMTVQYDDGNLDIVFGGQRFYVEEVLGRGYALRAWRDFGGRPIGGRPDRTLSPSESRTPLHQTSWSYVRSIFRPR